jgi:hypothetical protein
VHDVFHVSQLKKCLRVPEEQLPVEGLEVQEDLTYIEKPVQILETADRVTRRKTIRMCKVRWDHHSEGEATWEREDDLMAKYPELFFFLLTKFRRYSLFSSRFAPSSQFQSGVGTGVHITYKQNLSCHGCCIMLNHISLSDVVLNRVFCSVSFRDLDSNLWSRVLWASVLARDPARPSLASPVGPLWPTRPRRPAPPPCAPLPSLPFSHLIFPSSNLLSSTSLSLSPWCPSFWRW